MTTPRNILVFMGTRPEAVKLAPVVAALRGANDFRCTVVATGQHKEMFRQVAETFGFAVDADLDVMRPNQTLAGLTARLMDGIDGWLGSGQPDMALVQGDTTTVLVASLACFYRRIPIGHVEAGLRTGNIWSPFPEEVNRRLATPLVALHFAPTEAARAALLREAVPEETISVTGNTVIDALRIEVATQARRRGAARSHRRGAEPPRWGRLGASAHGPHHRAPPRELRRRHRADLPGHRHPGQGFPGPPFRLPGSPQPQRSGARQPAAGQPVERSAHRTSGLPQLRGAHGALSAGADRLGRGPGGGALAGQAGSGDARHHRAARGRGRRHCDTNWPECLRDRRACDAAAHGRGCLSLHGHRQESLRRRPRR